MVKQRNQKRDWQQRFTGFRVNCESVPRLPASIVQRVIDDPRRIAYLLLWPDRFQGQIEEALRVQFVYENFVEMKRIDGTMQRPELRKVPLPNRATAVLLLCPGCYVARRYLYAWCTSPGRVFRSGWRCRTCARLRYASEGSYVPRMFRSFGGGGYPRTNPWDPMVFSDSLDAIKYFPELAKRLMKDCMGIRK